MTVECTLTPEQFLREWWAEHGGEIFDFMRGKVDAANARTETAEAKLDQLLFALGCQLGGVESALQVIEAKNEAIETAEAELAALRERERAKKNADNA